MSHRPSGLTTGHAPFIERAHASRQLFIHQPFECYSEENHKVWSALWERQIPLWNRFASRAFLEGIEKLGLEANRIPRLEEINQRLQPLTGFEARAVSGYVEAGLFFECLASRQFPTTITIRDMARLSYLPEPDIFHDVAGHVPMHTDSLFADLLVAFGELGARTSKKEALARLFWFTIEFGLICEGGQLRAYGSGLLSSSAELEHAILSSDVERRPFNVEEIAAQPFEIDRLQPILFVVDSFDQVISEVRKWQ